MGDGRWFGFGVSYHAGFPQITAILGMFLVVGLAAAALADGVPLRRLAMAVPAVLFGIGLAAPLLLHHLEWAAASSDSPRPRRDFTTGSQAPWRPTPVHAELPIVWDGFTSKKWGEFYFFGGLFAALFAMQAFCFWVVFPGRAGWGRSWWVPCGMLAFCDGVRRSRLLWSGVGSLPMAKFFMRYTFRFYPVLAFCHPFGRRRSRTHFGDAAETSPLGRSTVRRMLLVLAYHLAMCRATFMPTVFARTRRCRKNSRLSSILTPTNGSSAKKTCDESLLAQFVPRRPTITCRWLPICRTIIKCRAFLVTTRSLKVNRA